MIVLMLIGDGSLSTVGGIKVGTVAVLLLTTWSFVRQQEQVNVLGHTVPEYLVRKSLAVTSISFVMVTLAVYALLVIEHGYSFTNVVFEVISALSTVGLSRGITTSLNDLSEVVIIFMMFAGRLEPLTLVYFIALPKNSVRITAKRILISADNCSLVADAPHSVRYNNPKHFSAVTYVTFDMSQHEMPSNKVVQGRGVDKA